MFFRKKSARSIMSAKFSRRYLRWDRQLDTDLYLEVIEYTTLKDDTEIIREAWLATGTKTVFMFAAPARQNDKVYSLEEFIDVAESVCDDYIGDLVE